MCLGRIASVCCDVMGKNQYNKSVSVKKTVTHRMRHLSPVQRERSDKDKLIGCPVVPAKNMPSNGSWLAVLAAVCGLARAEEVDHHHAQQHDHHHAVQVDPILASGNILYAVSGKDCYQLTLRGHQESHWLIFVNLGNSGRPGDSCDSSQFVNPPGTGSVRNVGRYDANQSNPELKTVHFSNGGPCATGPEGPIYRSATITMYEHHSYPELYAQARETGLCQQAIRINAPPGTLTTQPSVAPPFAPKVESFTASCNAKLTATFPSGGWSDTLEMTWTDATGAEFNGQDNGATINGRYLPNFIQPQTDDQNGAPFPGGHVRFRGIATHAGQSIDLIIQVAGDATAYADADFLPMQYVNPFTSTATQAALTDGGYFCLGQGVTKSHCAHGGEVGFYTATCPENELCEGQYCTQSTIHNGNPPARPPSPCICPLTHLLCECARAVRTHVPTAAVAAVSYRGAPCPPCPPAPPYEREVASLRISGGAPSSVYGRMWGVTRELSKRVRQCPLPAYVHTCHTYTCHTHTHTHTHTSHTRDCCTASQLVHTCIAQAWSLICCLWKRARGS